MHVLFLILKIIGILLLAILGILLTLILLVLFVPVRYKIDGEKEKEGSLKGKIKFSWLLHLISVYILINEEVSTDIKIFGISISSKEKNEDASDEQSEQSTIRKKRKQQKKSEEESKEGFVMESQKQEPKEEKLQIEETTNIDTLGQHCHSEEESKNESPKNNIEPFSNDLPMVVQEKQEFKEQKNPIRDKIKKVQNLFKKILRKISGFWNAVKNKYNQILIFIENIKQHKTNFMDKKEVFVQAWKDEHNRSGIGFLWKVTKRLLRHASPKKWRGYIHFGMKDPASTGKILGLISVFGAIIGILPEIQPDFEEEVLEGKCLIKGRIFAFYLIHLFIQVWKNKEFHGLLDNVRKIKEEL